MSEATVAEKGSAHAAGMAAARRQLLGFLKLFGGLALLIVIGIIVSPKTHQGAIIFLDPTNLFDVLARVSNVGVLAVGMTLVILTGGIDLSVGSVLSLGTVVTAMLLLERGWNAGSMLGIPALALAAGLACAIVTARAAARKPGVPRGPASVAAFLVGVVVIGAIAERSLSVGLPVPVLVLAVMATGLVVGCINGLLISAGGLQPFIATLASMISIWGLAWLVPGEGNARRHIESGGALDAFNVLGSRLGNVFPVPGLVFLAVVIGAHCTLRYTRLGRMVYAIGGNEDAARLSGIPVAGVKTFVYGLSGLLAALTGVLWAAQYHQGFPDAGQGAELDAIAAVVIGGTSLMGGRGTVLGTLMGVLMFGVLNNILTLLQYTTNWQRLVTGVIIAVAVLAQEGRVQAAARRFWRAK